ncbi:MAG TPA: hypothetical protein VNV62_25770 [Trebonia sp.]|nr:hypothetical protein [Trebonia sp.]
MDDVIGHGREPERDPRPPLPRHWRIAGWAMVGLVAVLAVFGLSRGYGAGSPGSSKEPASAPATWAVAQGGIIGVMFTSVQQPVIAFAAAAGGPGMVCSPSTGACSVRVQGEQRAAPTEPAASRATPRPALRAPGLW